MTKHLVLTFHWICSMNVYYLLCSCTNPIFGKNLGPEMCVKVLFSQSDSMILKLTISKFFACWYIFRKAKTCFKWFLGACSQKWTLTKRDTQNLHYETLTFYEWIRKLRWFLTCWCWCIVLYLLAIYHKNVITYIQVC